jgi:hypothetical protein
MLTQEETLNLVLLIIFVAPCIYVFLQLLKAGAEDKEFERKKEEKKEQERKKEEENKKD